MRIIATTTAVLAVAAFSAVEPAAAQTPLAKLGGDYTVSFTGDDFEGLESAFGVSGGVLFPVGPISHIGAELGWSGVSFDSDLVGSAADASILDFLGVVQVGLGYGESARPYVDLRAGYSRMSFDAAGFDGSISGPTAGGSVGVLISPGSVWFDVHARYQMTWFGETDDDLIFNTESSGGRVSLGAAVAIPFGGN